MNEITSTTINAAGTYSDYFQIGENGVIIFQGQYNPNDISLTPSPSEGDMYIWVSNPELFLYKNGVWVAVGGSTVNFFTQNITENNFTIGSGMSFSGTLFATVNINSASSLILPTGLTAGTTIIVKDISGLAATNTISVSTEDSSAIDAQSSVTIDINYGCYQFLYTGTYWTIISAISSFPINQLLLGGGTANNYTLPAISPYLSYVNNYEYSDFISGNLTTGQILSAINLANNLTIPENFIGSVSTCLIPPTNNSVVINITKNNVYVGTLTFNINSTIGVFSSSTSLSASPGDILKLVVTTSDSSIAGISFTLAGSSLFTPIIEDSYISISNISTNNTYYENFAYLISGSVYPNNSNIKVGYSTSNTVPPITWVTSTAVNENWNAYLTFPTANTYYVWAEQETNTSIYTISEIIIIAPSITISNTNDPTVSVAYNVGGSVFYPNATVQVGISSSNTVAPTTWYPASVSGSTWNYPNLVFTSTGPTYIWAEIIGTNITAIYSTTVQTASVSPIVVQSSISGSDGDSLVSLTNAPTPGNWLVALGGVWLNDAPNTAENWLDIKNSSTTYDNSNLYYLGAFYRQVVAGDTAGPYVPFISGNSGNCVGLFEISNIGSTFNCDQLDGEVDIATSTSSQLVGNAAVTTVANSLQIAILVGENGVTVIPQFLDSNWTLLNTISPFANPSGATEVSGAIAFRVLTSIGSSLDANVLVNQTLYPGVAYISANVYIG